MRQFTGTMRRGISGGFLALAACALPGCLTSGQRSPALVPECVESCQAVPSRCRSHVHVFLVNGFDPFDVADLASTKSALHQLGFNKVYAGQFYHARDFADEMRKLTAAESDVRFVLLGVGVGVEAARSIVDAVACDGIVVDLLACVDAPFWSSTPAQRPQNVHHVMHLHGVPSVFGLTAGANADVEIGEGAWSGVAAHPVALERLASELTAIAATVAQPNAPHLPAIEDTVTPRTVVERPTTTKKWGDFLRPASRLGESAPADRKPTTVGPET